jgi:cation-transporting ATPase E
MESGSAAARAVSGLVLLGDRFEILPRAIVEGRRVVAQMIAVASLLLARTIYMLLIVVVAALMSLPFPFTPKNNAVLSLVTVGIPTLVIALWVPPIRSPRSVVSKVLRYAAPAGAAIALLSIPIMMWAFGSEDAETGRSIITTLTVYSGIALIPILFPLVESRAGPIGRGGDARPTLLAIAMLALYTAITLVPFARDFFELRPLPIETIGPLLLYVAAWMFGIIGLLHLGIPGRVWVWLEGHVGRARAS